MPGIVAGLPGGIGGTPAESGGTGGMPEKSGGTCGMLEKNGGTGGMSFKSGGTFDSEKWSMFPSESPIALSPSWPIGLSVPNPELLSLSPSW
jgi:hypothetical protein